MKRVNVYKPKIQVSMVGKKRVTEVVDKKHEFLREHGVMDRTLEQYEVNEFNTIIQSGVYMEEVKEDAPPKRVRRTKEQIDLDKKQ
jgi:hypothetical protein